MTKLPSFLVMAVETASCWASTRTATCTRARGSPRSTLTTLPRMSAARREEAERRRIEDTTRMTADRRSRIYAIEPAKFRPTPKHYPQERRESGKLHDSGDETFRFQPTLTQPSLPPPPTSPAMSASTHSPDPPGLPQPRRRKPLPPPRRQARSPALPSPLPAPGEYLSASSAA